MKTRIRMDLAFEEFNKEKAEQARKLLAPFLKNAVVINEGEDNEERGYIEIENCGHDEGKPCTVLARWEVGRGKVK